MLRTQVRFQALNQLEIATHIEKTAITMHLDSIRTIKCALAGTATSKFTDVLEAVFGIDEEEVPEFDEEEDDPDFIPEEGLMTKEAAESAVTPEASTSSGVGAKRKATSAPAGRSSKRKASKPVKAGVCKLEDAAVFYLSSKSNYLHTGVPSEYISKREGSLYTGSAVYMCDYSKVEESRGNKVPFCDTVCQNEMQVSSHIRQFHLGICIACYICNHRWWSAYEWKKHMTSHHQNLPEDDYYVPPSAAPTDIQVKTEVTEKEFIVETASSTK